MKTHPLAELFPLMEAEQYGALKRSIDASGLLEPIMLLEGQILDGKNRFRACSELDIVPTTVEYEGEDPVGFVLGKNLARRHLDESQRAMIGARLANLPDGVQAASIDAPVTQPDAAERVNASRESVQRARKVLEDGASELIRAVDYGEIAVSAAKVLARLPKDDQREIVLTHDPKERREKIKAAKERAKEPKDNGAPGELNLTQQPAKEREIITLRQWAKLKPGQRETVLEPRSSGEKFLRQEGSSIEWARWSWNPVTGCQHNCPYCYARDLAARNYAHKFEPAILLHRFVAPVNTKLPDEARENVAFKNVFTCSMADLFGKWVPDEWIAAVLRACDGAKQWNFLMLTKDPGRAVPFEFPDNVWIGTTVDAQERVAPAEEAFSEIRCKTKWLSVEPLLEPLTFSRLKLFQWLVIGGASKSTKTPPWIPPMDWVAGLHQQARAAGLPVYYKTNCGMLGSLRTVEFPWQKRTEPKLPKSFRYLKGMKN